MSASVGAAGGAASVGSVGGASSIGAANGAGSSSPTGSISSDSIGGKDNNKIGAELGGANNVQDMTPGMGMNKVGLESGQSGKIDGLSSKQGNSVNIEQTVGEGSVVNNDIKMENNTTIIQDIEISMGNTDSGFKSKYGDLFDKVMENTIDDEMLFKMLELLQQKQLEELLMLLIMIMEESQQGALLNMQA